MTPEEEFWVQIPPPARISRAFDALSHENFQRAIRCGGVDFLWNNPMWRKGAFTDTYIYFFLSLLFHWKLLSNLSQLSEWVIRSEWFKIYFVQQNDYLIPSVTEKLMSHHAYTWQLWSLLKNWNWCWSYMQQQVLKKPDGILLA